ncbi:aminotransferase class V-fold PLP-dependent enzyme [Sphingomonas sp. AOB5]|uniref:aminotransferase class V-fold PLP-dependent enzyme n=1 Tax=Sphingomonas sp. AOB5 TaxID=3034017 RepID=UPI0023F89181|nr:aminotransferase class V-fold PLP-dependent enzyme [Sphingomonas sp. AOB5]MDF7776675.1 aminotransferase class V-fold PLP-dependent enzyme [Sphingomonas sp. AOB5]
MDRRTLLAGAALLPVSARAAAMTSPAAEPDWDAIAAQFDMTREVVQLEHGNWGMMARPVLAAYQEQVARVNRDTSYYARRTMIGDLQAVEARVATSLGVSPDEIVLTRNATEALNAAIGRYNKLRPGDALLYSDLDYDSMIACCDSLEKTRGVTIHRIAIPEPATWQGVIDAYVAAFDANPKIRLVLLTHLGHRTGLAIPVREIVAIARSRGIDCIVDAAHSVGQLDFALPDLDADFVGFNLHKWIGAPLGCGVLYVRKGRVADIDPDPGEGSAAPDSLRARVHTGTVDYAAQLTLPAAIDFQEAIGSANRATRLRALRDRWVRPLRGVAGIEILTPDDPRMHGAITSFRLTGRSTSEANMAVAKALLEQHGIFTVYRGGVAGGACVRVTPALATRMEDVDRLVPALRALAAG